MIKYNPDVISKWLSYAIIGGLAMLGQYVADKETERTASRAAANAVVNVLSERAYLERKQAEQQQTPHHVQQQ